MRLGILATSFVIGSLSIVVACSSNAPGDGQNPSSSSGNTSSGTSGTPGDGGPTNNDSGQQSSGSVPEPSKTDAPVDVDGTCPTLNACGGAISGTYDYTGGCVDDVFAAARGRCPTLDSTGVKVTVKGSLHFVNGALTRAASSNVSGTVIVPATCASGQCALAESLLKSAYPSASCTGTSSCSCTINDTKTTDSVTTYTVSGGTVTTADGDTYSFCVEGSKVTYKGKAPGSEDGIWTLAKR